MIFLLIVAVYQIMTNRPMAASLFFTMSLGTKAGALLMLPTFLGSIQYFYGTIRLIQSVVIIVGYQILVALPFVMNHTTVMYYLENSFIFSEKNEGARTGVIYSGTIFWHFVGKDFFDDPTKFANPLRAIMICVQIWHFFVRQGCTAKCFENLFQSFDFNKVLEINTPEQVRKCGDIILIGFF